MGFRAIERVKKVHHTTVINWVKQAVSALLDTPYRSEIPKVKEVDELETFVGQKKQNLALDSRKSSRSGNYSLGIRR